VWRSFPRTKVRGWMGPGVLVCVSADRGSAWVTMRGSLMKVNSEQLRRATDEEYVGAEIIRVLGQDAREHLERRGQRGYVDVTKEGPPDDEQEDLDQAQREAVLPAPLLGSGAEVGGLAPIPENEELDPILREVVDAIAEPTLDDASSSQEQPESEHTPRLSSIPWRRSTSTSSRARPEPEEPPPVTRARLEEAREESVVRNQRLDGLPIPPGGWSQATNNPYGPAGTTPATRASPYAAGFAATSEPAKAWMTDVWPEEPWLAAVASEHPDLMVGTVDGDMVMTWVATAKSDGTVSFRQLNEKDRETFLGSRRAEVESLIKLRALTPLSVHDSNRFREKHPEHVIPSMFIDRWKPTDDGGRKAKSRLVVLGWKDPEIYNIDRTAPTPTQEALMLMLQWTASEGYDAYSSDLKNAFGQALETTRKQKLACSQPPGGIPGLAAGQILRCDTEVYGLVSGPAWLRATLLVEFRNMAYIQNKYDKCLFSFMGPGDKIIGNVLLDVDDLVEAGSPEHRKMMENFYKKYQFGKVLRVKDAGEAGTLVIGRRVRQRADHSFEVDMNDYARDRLQEIKTPRGYLSNTAEIDEKMLKQVQGVVGGINWLAGTGRPDLSAAASIIPAGYKDMKTKLVSDCNAAVRQAKRLQASIKIWPIPAEERRVAVLVDSSTDTSGNQRHQKGYLICITNTYLHNSRLAPMSLVHWRSTKHTRKASSPQLCETYAASDGLTEGVSMKALLESMTWTDFDIISQRRRSRPLKDPSPQVLKTDRDGYHDPELMLVTDSKGLYDSLASDCVCEDKKSALEAPIIAEFLHRSCGRVRWIPHNENPADALTKMAGAHVAPLWSLLRTGMMKIKKEEASLADRKAEKDETGYASRQKVSAASAEQQQQKFST